MTSHNIHVGGSRGCRRHAPPKGAGSGVDKKNLKRCPNHEVGNHGNPGSTTNIEIRIMYIILHTATNYNLTQNKFHFDSHFTLK